MSNAELKILFIIFDNYKTERLGIQILSSIAREEDYQRELLILNSVSLEAALEKARAFQPQIVAYSAMTFENFSLQKFNGSLKGSGLEFISVFGGHHYTFNPEEIYRDRNIDIICRGEGEEAFRRLIQAVRDGLEYHQIDKLWVRRGEEVIKNPTGALIEDLDFIPFPDRKLISFAEGEEQIFGKSRRVMFSRGCPHRCAYCFNVAWNKLFQGSRKVRCRSADNVLKEIKQLVAEHELDLINFDDDDFSLLPGQLIEEFSRRYKVEIAKPFFIQCRAESIDENLIAMLKDAGLAVISVGVECGDETVAREILQRGNVSNKVIIRAFELFHKYGLKSFSQNLFALPVENPLEVDLETIRLNIQCKPTWAQCSILVPFPKTPIFDYAVKGGYLDENVFSHPKSLPSVFTSTRFNYKNPRLSDRVNNLHKFSSIVIKFPFLLPVAKLLIRLPPNRIFQYLFFAWYGYWNTSGLWNTKISFKLIAGGIKAIRQYLRKH